MQHKQTTYVILGLLSIESNQSGYDIRKTIQGSVSFFWGESYGQIYPTLKRLAAERLIVSRKSTAAARPQRQEYSITAAGHACLKEWLAVPYRDDPPRNEFLLKLFFGREATPSVSIAHIRDFQDKLKHMLATLLEMETLGRAALEQSPFPVLDAHAHLRGRADSLRFGMERIRAGHAFFRKGHGFKTAAADSSA